MSLLVDSSVWIDYFNGTITPQTDFLDAALGEQEIIVGDLILAEVLQGFHQQHEFEQAQKRSKAAGIAFHDASNYRAWAVKNLGDRSIKHVEENYDLPLE